MSSVDMDFTPYPVANGDQLFSRGIVVFDMTRMLEYIHKPLDGITLK